MDQNNRRMVGGKIEVKVTLREPLIKKKAILKKEKWIFLEEFDTSLLSQFISKPAQSLSPVIEVKRKLSNEIKSPKSVSPAPKPESSVKTIAVSKVSPSEPDEKVQELIDIFERVDLLVSNNVLEAELSTLQQKVIHDKVKSTVSEDDEDRIQQIQIKLQLLVIQVQTEQLTMESYLAQVKKSIDETKVMALEFKKLGSIEYAKKALTRLKIMQSEVTEAESG